jgi:3-oxoacyl-(acyl-carrier-protein) synthase
VRAGLAGVGCVTPLGSSPDEVWRSVVEGTKATPVEITNAESGRKYIGAPVPANLTSHLARESRLRRASAISLLSAAAGKAAMDSGGLTLTPEIRGRLALVFGVSSGGVQYTRRFYEQVAKQGANVASPMLFPETVYNAPASHLAAMLGVDGATYTLVGDGTVGLQALSFGAQLLACGDADYVLVVAAEELDWILLEAHRDWRLTADGANRGALLAEGAAAVLLAKEGSLGAVEIGAGESFTSRREAACAMDSVLAPLAARGSVDLVISGANDTWVDQAIAAAIQRHYPKLTRPPVAPKRSIGEALGAGALLQVVLATAGLRQLSAHRALVASLGWNQQAAAALVER